MAVHHKHGDGTIVSAQEEIKFVKNAFELGLGQIDLSKVRIKKVSAT